MMVTMMADRSLPQERGQIFAICIAGLNLGIVIAALVLGAIAQQVGYRDMFGYAAVMTSLALAIFLTQSSKDLSNSLPFALALAPDAYALITNVETRNFASLHPKFRVSTNSHLYKNGRGGIRTPDTVVRSHVL